MKASEMCNSDKRQAGTEIEVTPEMVGAGAFEIEVLLHDVPISADAGDLLAVRVFQAMAALAATQDRSPLSIAVPKEYLR